MDKKELPAHKVSLTKEYFIGKFEVTQLLWNTIMKNNPSKTRGKNFL